MTELHFINFEPVPGQPRADVRRRICSHKSRVALGKLRRQKVAEYQALRSHPEPQDLMQPRPQLGKKLGPLMHDHPIPLVENPHSPLGSGNRDPFASFARHLNATEEFFLRYYAQNVVPCKKYDHRSKNERSGNYPDQLSCEFVQLAATQSSSLDGLFLVTSRHLSRQSSPNSSYFTQLALQYKSVCARSLIEAISSLARNSAVSDGAVTLAIFLAQEAILMDDTAAMQQHLYGAIQMVKHNVALRYTDRSVFLYDLIQKDITYTTLLQSQAVS